MRKRERTLFRQALERKRKETERRGRQRDPRTHHLGAEPDWERRLVALERSQDVPDPRTKGAGHGQKTADKWNQ